MPQYYRLPIVLCDLEGHSYETASRYLGCPVGTIKSRVARGRERLRIRLVRRGVAPSAGAAILPAMTLETISAALSRSTAQSVMHLARGAEATAGAFSASVTALSEGVLKAMFWTRIRTAFAMSLVAGVAATGLGLLVSNAASEPRNQARQQPEPSKEQVSVAPAYPAANPDTPSVAQTGAATEPERCFSGHQSA